MNIDEKIRTNGFNNVTFDENNRRNPVIVNPGIINPGNPQRHHYNMNAPLLPVLFRIPAVEVAELSRSEKLVDRKRRLHDAEKAMSPNRKASKRPSLLLGADACLGPNPSFPRRKWTVPCNQ